MGYLDYVVRKFATAVFVFLGVCLLIFTLFKFINDNPAAVILGRHATTKQIEELNQQLGLNKPLYEQFFRVVVSAITFDYGRSWATKQKISTMIHRGLVPTLSFVIPSFFLGGLIALILALVVAYHRGKFIDRALTFSALALMSFSSLTLILFLQWFLGLYLSWFPVAGFERGFPEATSYLVLPILVWLSLSIGPDLRFFRTIILDQKGQDYVRTAKAKGLRLSVVYSKHVLSNCLVPIVTHLMLQLPFLILGALLIESFFGIPGVGSLLYEAINSSDFPVVKAISLLTATLYLAATFTSDLLYGLVDPRMRLR